MQIRYFSLCLIYLTNHPIIQSLEDIWNLKTWVINNEPVHFDTKIDSRSKVESKEIISISFIKHFNYIKKNTLSSTHKVERFYQFSVKSVKKSKTVSWMINKKISSIK